jgi:hypothetical protein
MKIEYLAVVLVACFSSCSFQDSAVAVDKPNIIFIMADDLGWQDVGYMKPLSRRNFGRRQMERSTYRVFHRKFGFVLFRQRIATLLPTY